MRKDVNNEIIRKGGDNINKSAIARLMGCSRQTIYNREDRLKNPKPKKLL
jgi:predicted DNA-binding transcriptional regulator AlpA